MPVVTENDHGPIVNVINLFLLVATILSVFTRTGMKWVISRKVNEEDFVIFTALVGVLISQSEPGR